MRPLAVISCCTVLGTVGIGCSSSSKPEAIAAPTTEATSATPPSKEAPVSDTTQTTLAETDKLSNLVVRSDHDLVVHESPEAASPSHTLAARTGFGSPLALLVTDARQGWAQVLIPGRPSGATGWVATDDIEIREVATALQIDLSARTLTLYDAGEVVLSTPVAIGSDDAPTPRGRFSITDKLESPDPGGAYGPYALGLSGRSEVLTEFAGGDGQIGIHGTNDPASIGQNVSHGCIRVPNEIIEELNAVLPLGTPVVVV